MTGSSDSVGERILPLAFLFFCAHLTAHLAREEAKLWAESPHSMALLGSSPDSPTLKVIWMKECCWNLIGAHIFALLSAPAPAQDGEPHGGNAAPAWLCSLELVEVVVENNRGTRECWMEVVSAGLGKVEIDKLARWRKFNLKRQYLRRWAETCAAGVLAVSATFLISLGESSQQPGSETGSSLLRELWHDLLLLLCLLIVPKGVPKSTSRMMENLCG